MGYYDGCVFGCCKRDCVWQDLRSPVYYRSGLHYVCGTCYLRCATLPGSECTLREAARRMGIPA